MIQRVSKKKLPLNFDLERNLHRLNILKFLERNAMSMCQNKNVRIGTERDKKNYFRILRRKRRLSNLDSRQNTVIRSHDVIFKSEISLKSTSELKLKINLHTVESTIEAKVDEEIEDVKEDATSRELEEASSSSGHQSAESKCKLLDRKLLKCPKKYDEYAMIAESCNPSSFDDAMNSIEKLQ